MIEITPELRIDEKYLSVQFVRASGPGGQNVNKVATAVQLRFNFADCESLSEEIKERLRKVGGKRVTEGGELIIDARRFRSQERNREDALNRLVGLIQKAAEPPPKPRKPTRLSRSAKARRLEAKKKQGEKKAARKRVDW